MKKALITGITGQDGSYLAEFLLKKGYQVHGLRRRNSLRNTERIDHLLTDPSAGKRFTLHDADLSDSASLQRVVALVKPDELYNLAAQSHVAVSFRQPEHTADVDAVGAVRLLEAIRLAGLTKKTKFYQASTSELFGKVEATPQKETTPFHPRSPYGVAKLYAYWITINYRESYGMYACNGILFNHESPRRGEAFVTRKITRALARVKLGLEPMVKLGNLDAKRDWGHAQDYVEMMWKVLQRPKPSDYVISTDTQQSVRAFVNAAAKEIGLPIKWTGKGVKERGVDPKTGKTYVAVDPRFFRPAEVDTLVGDSRKARRELGWNGGRKFSQLVAEMAREDLALAERELALKRMGMPVPQRAEES